MQKKILAVICMVILLFCTFSLSAYAEWMLSFTPSSSFFSIVGGESYYRDRSTNSPVYFTSNTVTGWSEGGLLQLNAPNSDALHLVMMHFPTSTSAAWNSGEVLSFNLEFLVSSQYYTLWSDDPSDYQVTLESQSGAVLSFYASNINVSAPATSSVKSVNVEFKATQTLYQTFYLQRSYWIYDLPFGSGDTDQDDIDIQFGTLYCRQEPSLEVQNTEKIVNAVNEAADEVINEDFDYETPQTYIESERSLATINDTLENVSDYFYGFLDQFYAHEEVVFSQDNSAYSFLWCWFVDYGFIFTAMLLCCFFLILRKIVL